MTTIRLADMRYPVTTLGPGTRLGIWVQGCSIGCSGCIARDTWDAKTVTPAAVDAAVGLARELVDGPLDGVTISGGEPFEQPEALVALIDGLRPALARPAAPALDVLCYSGRPLQVLRRDHPDVLSRLDAVIPDPYMAALPTRLPWRGSANQPIVALSPLGQQRYAAADNWRGPAIEVDVSAERVRIVGVPRRGDLVALERRLAQVGITLKDVTWRR